MKILLVAGHGASDPGAIGCGYREADLTREVVSLVKPKLEKYAEVTVYDFRRKLLADLNNGLKYNFKPFDYVLEVHFNAASATANGTEVLIHSKVLRRTVNSLVLQNIARLGFLNRGIKQRSDLGVMNACFKQSVNYSLLETCFISNSNDMNLYNKKKNEIATAIVLGIAEGFGLKKEDDEMTTEEKAKFNELVKAVSSLAERVERLDSKMVYGYVDDNMPEWAKPTIIKLMKKGILKGDEKGNLNLDENMLRTLVILDRAGIF